ncbi:hypothetical protein C8C94_4846 [Acidovorax sp. 94]|uniref:hypothetical protein n=1 Tax=Acidovorax sp. 94 TaxID=2135633 RepID=UPI000EB20E05|nr:hypothetical protein [Acidovorax sp. 94]RKR70300.1 hypothetical protein C8C94_4846 [Acidovorax sp. 94]
MHIAIKTTLATVVLSCAAASWAAIRKADLEYSFAIGWDLIGKLRACAAFDTSRNYHLASADVEKELLKFVRRSNLVNADYPELQASKVAIQATVNAEGLSGRVLAESKETAAKECQLVARTEAPEFVKLLQDITSGKRNIK